MSHNNHDDKKPQELHIQVSPETQRGSYSNQLFTSHTQEEFILDFILNTAPVAVVNARVIITPTHAKRMLTALQESIQTYESKFGKIAQINPNPLSDETCH